MARPPRIPRDVSAPTRSSDPRRDRGHEDGVGPVGVFAAGQWRYGIVVSTVQATPTTD